MSRYHLPPEPKPAPRWRWDRLAIAVVLLVGTGIGVYFFMSGGDTKRAEALRACGQGKLAEAEPVLIDILSRRPDDVEVRDALARAYTFADRPADAIPHLTWLIDAQPEQPEYRKLRMEQYSKLKMREEEYADARWLLDKGQGDDKLRRSVMGLAFAVGRFAEAEELCESALRDEPKDRGLRSIMANIRRARGDNDGAAKIFDELIREDPKNYGALLARGILYDEMGRSVLAIPLLRRVFNEDPMRKRTAGYQLSLALRKMYQDEEAKRVLAEVQRLQDVEVFTDAIKSQPDNLELQVRFAESLLRDGHTSDGLALLQSVLRKSPNFGPAHLALAEHYEKTGQANLAARHRQLAGAPRR
jgi:predicted Zn-dependent protease